MDLDSLISQLPDDTRESLKDVSPYTVPDKPPRGLWERLEYELRAEASSVLRTAGILLTVCVLLALCGSLDTGGGSFRYIMFAGIAAISSASLSDLDSCLCIGVDSVGTMAQYAKILLPVLSAAAAASGSVGGAAARYAATMLFISVLMDLSEKVIVPCICAHAALSAADAAIGNHALRTAKKLVKKLCVFLMTALSVMFTAWLSLTGVVTDTADAFAARAAKTTVSAALPVVGSILSDASSALAAAAGSLRCSIGIFGLYAVAGVCIAPFVRLGARFLAFKLSAALCECVSDKRLADFAEDLGACFGMMLGLEGAAALMMFFSIYSLIRTAI